MASGRFSAAAQIRPGFGSIGVNLSLKRRKIGEFLFRPEKTEEFQGDVPAVEVTAVIQNPGLHGDAPAGNGGPGTHIGNGGIGIITMKVKDNAGTTHEKRLSVAVTGETTGINNVWSEENIDVAKREFFTLDGKQATTFRQNDIYIMKVTDKNGKVYTMKAIRK